MVALSGRMDSSVFLRQAAELIDKLDEYDPCRQVKSELGSHFLNAILGIIPSHFCLLTLYICEAIV